MLLGLLDPSSPNLGKIFDLVEDPDRLWSDYGIRSLSKDHPLFGKGENYWRGPIWMPFNYMALSSLYKVIGTYSALLNVANTPILLFRSTCRSPDRIRRRPSESTIACARTSSPTSSRRAQFIQLPRSSSER